MAKMIFDDLDDDCLMEILELLTPKQLMKVARINKRMRDLVAVKLRVKIKILLVHRVKENEWPYTSACPHFSQFTSDQKMIFAFRSQQNNISKPTIDSKIAVLLAKCSGVKSVYFRNYPLNGNHLKQLVQDCPEVECIKFTGSQAKLEDWNRFFDKIGQQIVNLQVTFDNQTFTELTMDQFIDLVASKCVNIKQMNFMSYQSEGLVELIKKLPKSCRIGLFIFQVNDINPTEDLVENIDTLFCVGYSQALNWSGFRNRVERLSLLKFLRLTFGPTDDLPPHGVVFAGLKQFEFLLHSDRPQVIECLSISRFPQLETVGIYLMPFVSEVDFSAVIKQMQSVKQLIFSILMVNFEETSPFPGPYFHSWLANLETIEIIFKLRLSMEPDQLQQQMNLLLQPLERYVDEIRTLKKLSVKASFYPDNDWSQAFVDWMRQLKEKQNRVKVVVLKE